MITLIRMLLLYSDFYDYPLTPNEWVLSWLMDISCWFSHWISITWSILLCSVIFCYLNCWLFSLVWNSDLNCFSTAWYRTKGMHILNFDSFIFRFSRNPAKIYKKTNSLLRNPHSLLLLGTFNGLLCKHFGHFFLIYRIIFCLWGKGKLKAAHSKVKLYFHFFGKHGFLQNNICFLH